jgi:phage tail-like protein
VAADDAYYDEFVSTSTFLFEVDGLEIGQFQEVNGLEVEVGVESLEEGGENGFVHRLPGRMSWPNISLKRGITQTNNLFEWLNKSSGEQFASSGNKLTRSTAAITLIGPGGKRLRAWEFVDAFPVKWRGPEFAAGSDNGASEQLEIAHHGFRAKNL